MNTEDIRHRFSGVFLATLPADLKRVNLSGSFFAGGDFSGKDLVCADLSYADLRGSDLRGADLRGVKTASGPEGLL